MLISEQISEALAKAGFMPKNAGTFQACLSKSLSAWDMPYLKEHVIDDENVYEATVVVVEVTLDGNVTLTIPDFPSANEGPESVNSDEGMAILRDAGVRLAG